MNADQVARFVAVLSLICWLGSFAVVGLLVARRFTTAGDALLAGLGSVALWFAAAVTLTCTLGSLYFSEFAHYLPCDLCWFQRICMYPLAVTFTIAAFRRDAAVWRYAVVPASVGAVIAIYHTQLQAFPDQKSFCPTAIPCTIRYVWEFGFVSLPFMALAGFVFALLMLRVANLGTAAPVDDLEPAPVGSER
jgi:disulfide bond formation protein DsbB